MTENKRIRRKLWPDESVYDRQLRCELDIRIRSLYRYYIDMDTDINRATDLMTLHAVTG